MKQHWSGGATTRLRTSCVTSRAMVVAVCIMAIAPWAGTPAAAVAGTASETSFVLSADYVGLFPGADTTVPVTVRNPQQYALLIRSATISVIDASPQCVASNVTAFPFTGDVTVAAGVSVTIPVRMRMSPSAPDACQGATFPLSLRGTGEILGSPAPTSGFAFTGFGTSGQVLAGIGVISVLGGLVLLVLKRRHDAAATQ